MKLIKLLIKLSFLTLKLENWGFVPLDLFSVPDKRLFINNVSRLGGMGVPIVEIFRHGRWGVCHVSMTIG